MASSDYWWNDEVKWGLSITTAPAEEPVTVAEIRSQARILDTEENDWIQRNITAARMLCETFIKRTFVSTTLRLSLDAMPKGAFYLPRPNLRTVTSIKYLNSEGVQETLAANKYTVDAYSAPGRITPAYGLSWPDSVEHTNAIEVIYVAGYGAASAVPESIKQAIRMTVAQWFLHRGDEGDKELSQIPRGAKDLLRSQSWGYLP